LFGLFDWLQIVFAEQLCERVLFVESHGRLRTKSKGSTHSFLGGMSREAGLCGGVGNMLQGGCLRCA
jgi:hypothetical protein